MPSDDKLRGRGSVAVVFSALKAGKRQRFSIKKQAIK